ncbi:MAG: hypothetical protein GC204_20220 [Chloroflexi bacterium]|nr:hypothetical protein [Chloroflexota bacterium]
MASAGGMNNGKDPYYWRESAVTALTSARLLYSEYDRVYKMESEVTSKLRPGQAVPSERENEIGKNQIYPALMMMGYAIENALKGVIVAGKVELVSREKVDKSLKIHDLCALAGKAGITLGADEAGLLKMLEHYVTWSGRYPIPLHGKDYREFKAGRRLEPRMDFAMSESIFNRIDAVLTQQKPFHDLSLGTHIYE